jgi:hypothetical protein
MEGKAGDTKETEAKSLHGLLGAATERVQVIIEAAEASAAGILEDARAEARRYADETRNRIDSVSTERTNRISELTDELTSLGDELIKQAAAMRAQAQTLSAALGRATNELYTDLEEQEAALEELGGGFEVAAETELEELELEAEAELEAEDIEDEFGEEGFEPAPGAGFPDEATEALEENPEGIDDNGQPSGDARSGSLGRFFRRREPEPQTSEVVAVDEPADDDADADEETEPELK